MVITFADGTSIEVAASALDAFILHDLKWVEFVHGRASNQELSAPKFLPKPASSKAPSVSRCRTASCSSGC